MGKDPIKKSFTVVSNFGQGSAVGILQAIVAPVRSATGGVTVIRDVQNTSTTCNVGDIVKYVHFIIQSGVRDPTDTDLALQNANNGWIEWCVVYQKEAPAAMATTNLGVKTLGAIAMAQFRGDCLLTGQFPIGNTQPLTQEIMIKIPKDKCKIQLGSGLFLFTAFRSVSSTDVRTDSHRMIQSCFYKNYV